VTLDDVLREIHDVVEGARAVLLVGLDGIVVACAPPEGARAWEAAAAAYADLYHKARATQEASDLAPPDEIVVGSAAEFAVLRTVTDEYAVLAIVDRGGSLGRARFEMRRRAPALADEL